MAHVDDVLSAEFVTSNLTTGALANADSLPTAVIRRNGTALVGTDIAVVNKGTGLYVVSVTLASGDGWIVGDYGQIEVSWAMGAVGRAKAFNFAVVVKQTGDNYARLGGPAGASIAADIAAIPTNPMLATEDGSSFTAIPDMATATSVNAIPAAVEAVILDEGDATALLAAIAAKVEEFLINEGDATATIAAIATAVNSAITSAHGSGSYQTATGFATTANVTDARDAVIAEVDANETKIDAIITDLGNDTDGLGALLAAIGTRQATIANLASVVTMASQFATMVTLSGATYKFTPDVSNSLADHTRRRTQANVKASSDGDALSLNSEYGFIQQAQNSNTVNNSGKITVYDPDDVEIGQLTTTGDAAADPLTGVS